MMKNVGALQDNILESAPAPARRGSPLPQMLQQQQTQQMASQMNFPEALADLDEELLDYASAHDTAVNLRVMGQASGERRPTSSADEARYERMSGGFWYTVQDGNRVMVVDKLGTTEILEGPCRVWRGSKRFTPLEHHVAYPGEFLIVRNRDGSQRHLEGPVDVWVDPRVHSKIEKEDSLQIAAKEAIVVYAREQDDSTQVKRRIVEGPAVFVPEPGEWLHTFNWHGSKGPSYKKVPGAMTFQKLWFLPDQMYHDIEDVRTADDVVLTVKLMIFFELSNVEKMLDETHDPIGDFINATSSDVMDIVGKSTFDEFKTRANVLNELESYAQLLGRAAQVGYRVSKIVYRGYATTAALQSMHEQAIETRTRLKLERETENQAQELADFKQQREFGRAARTREQDKDQEVHDLDKKQKRHEQALELARRERKMQREERRKDEEDQAAAKVKQDAQRVAYLSSLREMGVELTDFLTQGRADQVIELRGGEAGVAPHVHLGPGSRAADDGSQGLQSSTTAETSS